MFKNILLMVFASLLIVGCSGGSQKMGSGVEMGGTMTALQREFAAEVGDKVYFGYDKSDVSDEAKATLDKQVAWLNESKHAKVKVSIQGHADERGTREYNLALGERRAHAVRKYLKAAGVDNNRLSTISFGKERPDVVGENEEVYAKNRRVHSVVEE